MNTKAETRATAIALRTFSALCLLTLYACGGGSSGGLTDQSHATQQLAPRLTAVVVLDDDSEVGTAAFPKGSAMTGGPG